jgi:hypothetical protein
MEKTTRSLDAEEGLMSPCWAFMFSRLHGLGFLCKCKPGFPLSNSRRNLVLSFDANIHAGSGVNTAFRR